MCEIQLTEARKEEKKRERKKERNTSFFYERREVGKEGYRRRERQKETKKEQHACSALLQLFGDIVSLYLLDTFKMAFLTYQHIGLILFSLLAYQAYLYISLFMSISIPMLNKQYTNTEQKVLDAFMSTEGTQTFGRLAIFKQQDNTKHKNQSNQIKVRYSLKGFNECTLEKKKVFLATVITRVVRVNQ